MNTLSKTRKYVINTYMKSIKIPALWKTFFLKIANNRDYILNFCNNPYSRFHRHCREWYMYNLMKNNTDGGDDDNIFINEVPMIAYFN